MSAKAVVKPRQLTAEQRAERNRKARARHWLKTGVSQRTVEWMKARDML